MSMRTHINPRTKHTFKAGGGERQTWVWFTRMHPSTHTARSAGLRIRRLHSAPSRRATAHRAPITRIVGNIVRPGRHGRWSYSTTTGRSHTRGLTLNERGRQRSRRYRCGSVALAQTNTQSLELMTTQCRCQRRRLHCMLATTRRGMIASVGGHRPAVARVSVATPAEHRTIVSIYFLFSFI